MSFRLDGFLSPDLNSWTQSARTIHKDWFGLAQELNRASMTALWSIRPHLSSDKQLVASLIFGRALESFQGVILLSERGMMADARMLVRGCVESAIALGALCVDDVFLDDLISGSAKHRTTLATALLNSSALNDPSDRRRIDKLKQVIDEHQNDRRNSINWEQAARKAGFSDLYDIFYRGISGDAAHVSIDSLNRHLETDADQNITGLIFKTDSNDLNDTLFSAVFALIHSLDALGRALVQTDIEQTAINYAKRMNALHSSGNTG